MATPMTAAQWKQALEKWAVPVVYRAGWETHGRPGRPWGGVNGIIVHHTGSDTDTAAYVDGLFLEKGMRYPSLPGPLCHASTGPNGVTTMGATRRANHAGAGTARTFNHVVNEDYAGYSSELTPGGSSGVDGNTHFYGNEVRFSGAHAMSPKQYDSVVRWCAAICDFHGWSALSIIGHREWTSAKPDPGKTPLDKLRRDVAALLKAGPTVQPTPPPPAPTRHTSSVLIQNCASNRNDATVGGSWAKRLPLLAKVILDSDASFIVCPELYEGERQQLAAAIAAKYAVAGYKGGRVLFYRKGRWATSAGSFWKNLLNNRTKPAVVDFFINLENKSKLTVSAWHTSYETNAEGSRKRRIEVNTGILWIKALAINYGRNLFAGDFNSPADGSTRIDDVEPVFERYGYHDLEDDHEVANGPGNYHLDRAFAGKGVKGERIAVVRHKGSDHPATYVEFSY